MNAAEMQTKEGLGRGLMLLPILLTAVLYLFTTTDRGVIDYDEGYYAQAAKGMAETGNWVTPYVNAAQTPGPRIALHVISLSCSSDIFPAFTVPTALYTSSISAASFPPHASPSWYPHV